MHSFVARLRGRAISQTTTNSNLSEELDTLDTPTSPHSTLPATSDPQTAIIDRKILPQVNELLESYSIQEHADVVGEQSSGLSPRPLRRGPYEPAGAEAGETSSESAIPSERRGSIARISRRFTSSTPWSTFGRTTASPRRTPRSEREGPPSSMRFHFGSVDTFAAPRPSRSSVSIAHVGTDSPGSASHTRRPSRASEASSWRFGSLRGRSYSLNAMSQDPVQSSRPTSASGRTSVKDSATTTSSASTNTHAHTPIISPTNMPAASDSRYTFGNTSPSLHLSAFVTPSTSPIPNMDTPEFINTLTIHSRPSLRDTTNSTPPGHDAIPPLRHWTSSLAAKTFPPRRRRKTVGGESDENTLPFPSTSGRRLRTSASAPGVRHIFQHQPPTPKSKRRQASSKSSRRSSADWSARQASAGVTSNVIGEYGWPAQVSREMIRLSLGEQAAASKDKVAGKRPMRESANPDISQRGHNVPRSSQVAGRPCPPLLSPNSSPPNLEGASESGDKPSWTQDVQTDIPVFNKPGGVVEGQSSMSARNGVELSTLKEEGDDARQAMTLPRAATDNRVYRKSILRHSSSLNPQDSEAGPSSLETPLTSTPKESRRSSARRPARYASEPSIGQIPETPLKNKGKRKAEDLDLTPPDHRTALQHTTFVIPSDHRRTHRQSEPSRIAPSAYQHKRVRLSSQSPAPTPSHSRPGSSLQQANPNVTDSPSYRLSTPPSPAVRAMSRATSTRSMQPSVAGPAKTPSLSDSRRERRRSVSEVSFPIGAIVSPQPPSISRSSTYHMRDPRRPPRVHSTSWIPHFKSEDEEASSIHAWLFYISFILFPLWWVAALLPIPRTRHVGGSDTEKAVPLDDPQIEHDARSWRFRCRIMAGISFLTYIPFIVLVAVFAPR